MPSIAIRDVHRGTEIVDLDAGGILLCDIDGTLADITHRKHHLEVSPKNWDAFFNAAHDDTPIPEIIEVVRSIQRAPGWKVWAATGRKESLETTTRMWLARQGLVFEHIYMRSENDRRPDDIVKFEILARLRRRGYAPTLVLEDRSRVVAMWRREGIRTIQVNYGDF